MSPELPSKERIHKVLSDINLTEKALDDGVVLLRAWLQKQPHLPKSADNDTLKSFIVGSKSIERAKAKIDAYYTARIRFTNPFFEKREPERIKWLKGEKIFTLPGLTPDNCKVIMFTMPERESVPEFKPDDNFRTVLMFFEMMIKRFYMCSGVYVLADMSNLSLELTLKGSMTLSSQFANIIQECFPVRPKAFVAFNCPSLADTFFNTFVKPFFNEKMKNRMFLNSLDHKCVEKFVPLDMLPADYDGKSDSSDTLFEMDKKYLNSMQKWFSKEGSEKPMEDFRPKPDNDEMKGTFRKIETE